MKSTVLALAAAAGIGVFGAREAAAFHRSYFPRPNFSIQFGAGRGYYGGGYYAPSYPVAYGNGYCARGYETYGPAYSSYRPYRLVRVFVPYPYPHYVLRRVYRRSPYRRYGY